MIKNKSKILIIRFSSIGDIVLTTPVVRCLQKQFPDGTKVHYFTKAKYHDVLRANPYISKIYTIQNNASEIISELKAEKYDFIVDLHNNIRSGYVKRKLGKLSFSVNKINFRKWLMVNFKINFLPDVHIVDRYFDTLDFFAVKNDGKGLDYFIPPEDEMDILQLPEPLRNGYVVFAIGARHNTKCMPVEKIASICRKIDRPLLLLGDASDMEKGEIIEKIAGSKIQNGCGKYSINQSASLIRQADLIICHDSGLMHIAAAFKKRIISIWGNTVTQFGMYPCLPAGEGSSTIIEVSGLSCRPCTKLGFRQCPKKHFRCMNDINEESVVMAAAPPLH